MVAIVRLEGYEKLAYMRHFFVEYFNKHIKTFLNEHIPEFLFCHGFPSSTPNNIGRVVESR